MGLGWAKLTHVLNTLVSWLFLHMRKAEWYSRFLHKVPLFIHSLLFMLSYLPPNCQCFLCFDTCHQIASLGVKLMSALEGCPVLPSTVQGEFGTPTRQDKGVCHFKARGKKKQWNTHSLSLALTLTLTATLSPNHYTTSNFGRPCTQLRLYAS